jgi:repressor LexA
MRTKRYLGLCRRKVVPQNTWLDDADDLKDATNGASRPDQALRPGSIVGVVRAGEPEADAFVEETPSESLLDEFKVRSTDVFFRVRGFSMMEAGIEEGDLVQIRQVRPGTCPPDGEIVLAEVDVDQAIGERSGRITIKRFYRHNKGIRLQPANSNMSPLDYEPNEVAVLGIVVNIIRQFAPL